MITVETLTEKQINQVYRLGADEGRHGNPDIMHVATVARNAFGDFTAEEQEEARAKCVEILNREQSNG